MISKQKREYNNFSSFYKLSFDNQIDFEQPDPPMPDIVFIKDNKKIGCEITTIFRDNEPGLKYSDLRKNESIQDSICKDICVWIERNIPAFFEIRICFKSRLIDNSQIVDLRHGIVKVIEASISDLNLSEKSYLIVDNFNILPAELDYLSITSFPGLNRNYVTRAGADFIPKLSRERIFSNILHKEKALEKYSNFFDETWLLLVIQDNLFSSEFDVLENEYQNIASQFNKIFLFSKSDRKIIEIK